MFTDDLLLFSKASMDGVGVLARLLRVFANRSGLSFNPGKSSFMASRAVSDEDRVQIGAVLDFPAVDRFERYLGFPMFSGRVTRVAFDFLVEIMAKKMHGWKRKLLNRAARVTLAKVVLASVSSYVMQVHWIPQQQCMNVDRCLRNFIWKSHDGVGINLVNWEMVALPRAKGGLGLRKTRTMNTAMLGKLVSVVAQRGNQPWAWLLRAKYGCQGVHFPTHAIASPTCRGLCKATAVLREGFVFRLGDGCSNVWTSPWPARGCLRPRVPYIHISDSALRVRDLFIDGAWNLERLYTPLDTNLLEEFFNHGPR